MTEQWLPVPGYAGLYEVSDLGRVRSLDRVVTDRRGRTRRIPGVLLSQSTTVGGYKFVGLKRNGWHRTATVHRLVLLAFVGEPPHGHEACHGPGGAADNRLVNLRWDTRGENNRDIVRQGNHYLASRSRCPRGHELVNPNLIPSQLVRGRRSCLACCRARSVERNVSGSALQLLSDSYFAKIMNGAAA